MTAPEPGGGWFRPYAVPSPPPGAEHRAAHRADDGAGTRADARAADAGADEDPLIRPFLVTGGRTWTDEHTIRIESLVRAVDGAETVHLRFEARRIVELSRRPTSLAELAVALDMPVGVIRVLVGDLVASDTVAVVQVEEISLSLLERIRDRVRAL